MIQSFVDSPYRAFAEEVAGALTGKEGYFLELGATGGVQLATTGKVIGVMHGKLQGSNDINVRLIGKGGTVKVVQGGAIALGARVKAASGGKGVSSSTTGDRSLGVKISPAANGADTEWTEILDNVEYVP